MQKILLVSLVVFYNCSSPPSPEPEKTAPTKPSVQPEVLKSPFAAGLMNEYDVWEFLKESPKEDEVLQMLGLPDSIWVDEYQESKLLYYFIPRIQDYNSIEINIKTGVVTGFEWD